MRAAGRPRAPPARRRPPSPRRRRTSRRMRRSGRRRRAARSNRSVCRGARPPGPAPRRCAVKPDRSANSTVAARRSASAPTAGAGAAAASFSPQPGQKAKPTETSNWHRPHFIATRPVEVGWRAGAYARDSPVSVRRGVVAQAPPASYVTNRRAVQSIARRCVQAAGGSVCRSRLAATARRPSKTPAFARDGPSRDTICTAAIACGVSDDHDKEDDGPADAAPLPAWYSNGRLVSSSLTRQRCVAPAVNELTHPVPASAHTAESRSPRLRRRRPSDGRLRSSSPISRATPPSTNASIRKRSRRWSAAFAPSLRTSRRSTVGP